MRTIGLLSKAALIAAVTLAAPGCYNTNKVVNGGLVCSKDDTCPDGFVCRHDGQPGQSGHCWRTGSGPDAGSDAKASDSDSGSACSAANATAPFGPFAGCSPVQYPSSTCDPVCQSGCPCSHRCVLESSTYSFFVCEPTAEPASSFLSHLATCDEPLTDRCGPGSLCVGEKGCPHLCYRTCRNDGDCPNNTRCTASTIVNASGGFMDNLSLCSPPVEQCNPTGLAACAGAKAGFACVFLAGMTGVANTDATVCDCATLHDKKLGAECHSPPDDCSPGTVCVDGRCRTVCSRLSAGSPCAGGGVCNSLFGSAQYGYCR